MDNLNLYRVNLVGMRHSFGDSYVVANAPSTAYKLVKDYLDSKDIGFTKDRELGSVELVAKSDHSHNVNLFIQSKE